MQAFDKKRKKQAEVEAGIVKFNQKPKDGLAYLVRGFNIIALTLRLLGTPAMVVFSSFSLHRPLPTSYVCNTQGGAFAAPVFVARVSSFCMLSDWSEPRSR